MIESCRDCPFNRTGPGAHLRRTLRRWPEILRQLRGTATTAPTHFLCHKTTGETGDGSNRVCAGALAYQAARGVSSNYQRVCERLAAFAAQRAARRQERP